MKLTSPIILLLGSIFSLSLEANAVPLTPRQRGIITLPLKRVQPQNGVHPQLMLQQHINRAHRRLARMTGRQEPSDKVLLERLVSRHAHLVGRTPPRIGHAAAHNKQGRQSSVAPRKASVRDNNGFSEIDLEALENDSVTKANNPSAPNSLGLDIEANDVGYLMNVQIGTPPRSFSVIADTGSADFWVGGENCRSEDNQTDCGQHQFLGSQSSSSFVDTSQPFSVTYGSGSVAGDIVKDNVVFAGFQLIGHTFGVALNESQQFVLGSSDGLMGLAQSTLSEEKTSTPVESLAQAGLIQSAIASYKLSRLSDQKNDGEITLGGLDPTKFDPATLVTLPNVNTQGFWEGQMDGVAVDGTDLNFNDRTAILDTGTTLLIVPEADAQTIHDKIPGAKSDGNGGYTVPCNTNASVVMSFGGQDFAIDPSDIAFAPVDPTALDGDCTSGIAPGNIGGPTVWLAGDVFIKNAYLSTNVEANAIQLAQLT